MKRYLAVMVCVGSSSPDYGPATADSVGTKMVHYLDGCEPEHMDGLVSRLLDLSGFAVWVMSHPSDF